MRWRSCVVEELCGGGGVRWRRWRRWVGRERKSGNGRNSRTSMREFDLDPTTF